MCFVATPGTPWPPNPPPSPLHVEIRKFYLYPGRPLEPLAPGPDTLGWALGLGISLSGRFAMPKHTTASVWL